MTRDVGHADVDLVVLGRAAYELVVAGVIVAEPDARDEVRRDLLVRAEVVIERDEHERVLLRALPATGRAMREQPVDQLRR